MNLALFDLDNTLLACDSDYEWGQFLVDRGVLDRADYEAQNAAFYEQYKAGTLDIHEFLGFALRPLAEHSARGPRALARRVHGGAHPPGDGRRRRRALVRRHLDAGDLCAVVTATNSFVTGPIAREFGVPHLVATEPEQAAGRFTGRVAGTPCFREGKIARVDAWLAGQGRALKDFPESSFYSDSHNDLPLLERVTHPVAVDPDPKLAAVAAGAGLVRSFPPVSLR